MREFSDYQAMTIEDRRSTVRALRKDVHKLETICADVDDPKAVAVRFGESIPRIRAKTVVASLVNGTLGDARICVAVRDWARRTWTAWDGRSMTVMGVSSTLHPARLDQIAYEMAKADR